MKRSSLEAIGTRVLGSALASLLLVSAPLPAAVVAVNFSGFVTSTGSVPIVAVGEQIFGSFRFSDQVTTPFDLGASSNSAYARYNAITAAYGNLRLIGFDYIPTDGGEMFIENGDGGLASDRIFFSSRSSNFIFVTPPGVGAVTNFRIDLEDKSGTAITTPLNLGLFDVAKFGSRSGRVSFETGDVDFLITFLVTDPIPEPAIWAFMIVGMGGVGVAARRNRTMRSQLRAGRV